MSYTQVAEAPVGRDRTAGRLRRHPAGGGGRRRLIDAGLPPFAAEQVVTVFGELRRGVQATTTGTVNALTGRSARSFATFARQYAGAFRSEEPTELSA